MIWERGPGRQHRTVVNGKTVILAYGVTGPTHSWAAYLLDGHVARRLPIERSQILETMKYLVEQWARKASK